MVLWFAQILPKHMAATNPDRYLRYTRGTLFPCVEAIRMTGVPKPAEWVAGGVENALNWHTKTEDEIEEAPARREETLGDYWRELIPTEGRPSPPLTQRPAYWKFTAARFMSGSSVSIHSGTA